MADHNWVNDHIASYLAGGLDAGERAELEAHIAACVDCSRALAEARRLDQELANLFRPFHPGPDLEDRAIRRLRLQGVAKPTPPLGKKTIRFLLAAAALLLLGLTGATASYLIGDGGLLDSGGDGSLVFFLGGPQAGDMVAMAGVRQLDGVTIDNSQSMSLPVLAERTRQRHLLHLRGEADFFGEARLENDDIGSDPDAPTNYNVDRIEDVSVPGKAENPLGPLRTDAASKPLTFEEKRTGILFLGGQGQVAPSGVLPGALAPPTRGPNSSQNEEDLLFSFSVGFDGPNKKASQNYYSYRDQSKPADQAAFGPPVLSKIPFTSRLPGNQPSGPQGGAQAGQKPGSDPPIGPPLETFQAEREDSEPAARAQAQPEPKAEPKQPAAAAERKIIRSGEMEFEVDSFDSAVERVEKIAAEEGGLVATVNSDKLPNGKMKGSVVLRVPPGNLDDLIKKLRALGELKRQRLGSQDITKLYYDIDSRLKAARTMEKRLLEIIARGGAQVKDLIEAERELGVWRTRIEEMEGEIRYYNNLVGLATLTVQLTEKDIRSASSVVEQRKIDLGIEVEDVEAAQRQAQELIAQAKGRLIRAEARKGEAGSFQAVLHFEAAPDAAGPLLDALKQLGTVTRQEMDQAQQTEDGVKRPLDAKVTRADVQFQLSLFNLATAAPEQTIQVSLACPDVEAAYKQILARANKAALRVLASNLDQSRADQSTASLAFEVRTADADGILALVKQAGEVMRLQEIEAPAGGQVTRAKRGFKISFHSLASVKPREVVTLGIVATDAVRSYQALQEAVAAVKGRTLKAVLSQQDNLNVSGQLDFDVRRGDEAAIHAALARAGAVHGRSVQRDTGEDALDSKIGYRIHIISQSALKPREIIDLGIEVPDVERSVAQLNTLVGEAKGRTVSSTVARNRAGEVTARVIYDVPLLALHRLADEFKREGQVRVQNAARNPEMPDNELAIGRLEVTLANPPPIVAGDASFGAAMHTSLRKSASILLTCVVFAVAGLIVTSPVWIILLLWWLIRRRSLKAGPVAAGG